jgi:hypothetical protein
MNLKSKTTYLITAQAILFFSFLIITFFFNRFAVDDYFFIGELRTKTFSEIYQKFYFESHGRWTSNFLMLTFIQLRNVPFFLFLYNIISIGLLYISITRLLKALDSYYQLQIDQKQIATLGVLALSVLFFCTISANETWFWYTSSIVYIWSILFLILSVAIFFKQKIKRIDYFLFGIGLIYIGGSNEPLALFMILLLLYLIIKNKKKHLSYLGLVIITSAFLINYLSPGTTSRDAITPSLGVIDLLLYTGYGSIKFLFFSIYKTFIPAIFLAIPFYLFGKKNQTVSFNFNFNPKKELIKSFLMVGIIVFFNQLIVVYVLAGLAPDRSTISSSLAITLIIIRYLFLLGNKGIFKSLNVNNILIFNVIALFGFTLYFTNIHFIYAKAVDERIESIKLNNMNTIQVKVLPNSGYIYSAEITADPNHYKNKHLKNGLGIKNDIVLKP